MLFRTEIILPKVQSDQLLQDIRSLFIDIYGNNKVLDNPHITPEGTTYSEKTIKLIIQYRPFDFMDGSPLAINQLRPNNLAANLIAYYMHSQVDVTKIPDLLLSAKKSIFVDPCVTANGETIERDLFLAQVGYTNKFVKNIIDKLIKSGLLAEFDVDAAVNEFILISPKETEKTQKIVTKATAATKVCTTEQTILENLLNSNSLRDPFDGEFLEQAMISSAGTTFSVKYQAFYEVGASDPVTQTTIQGVKKNVLVQKIVDLAQNLTNDASERLSEIEVSLHCPLGNLDKDKYKPGILENPVVANDNITYNRENLVLYLKNNSNKLPGGQVQHTKIENNTNFVNRAVIDIIAAIQTPVKASHNGDLKVVVPVLTKDQSDFKADLDAYKAKHKQNIDDEVANPSLMGMFKSRTRGVVGLCSDERKVRFCEKMLNLLQYPNAKDKFSHRDIEISDMEGLAVLLEKHKAVLPKAFLEAKAAYGKGLGFQSFNPTGR